MTENHPTEFLCPDCGSGYKVVRVKADADLPHRLIYCRVCKHPLTAMDGQHALKYFLVQRASVKQHAIGWALSFRPQDRDHSDRGSTWPIHQSYGDETNLSHRANPADAATRDEILQQRPDLKGKSLSLRR